MKPENFGKTDYNKNRSTTQQPGMKNPQPHSNKNNWATGGQNKDKFDKVPKDRQDK